MTVHGMVFNNITPPHKTPNNVGQVEYCNVHSFMGLGNRGRA